jgi:hypothetical protein
LLTEIAVIALESVHDKAVMGEEVDSFPVVDDFWIRRLNKFQELSSPEFNPI